MHLPNSPLVPRLKTLSFTLLAHKVDKETRRQVEQLRGEMRDRWRAEAWRVKASWMAGVVPSHEGETQQGNANERTAGKDAGDEAQNADDPLLQPTIISDADGTAEMSRQVDDKVESSLEEQMKVAEEVVRGSVERSEGMEMELWLGQAVGRVPLLPQCLRGVLTLFLSPRSSTASLQEQATKTKPLDSSSTVSKTPFSRLACRSRRSSRLRGVRRERWR